jgi:long-chain acyl-CoA synthetase
MNYLEKPWLKSYRLGPYALDHSVTSYPEVPLYHLLDDAAARYPGRTAILFQGRQLKYRELRNQVDRLATALAGLDVQKGDRVCLFLPNCVEFILCYWAVLKAGGVVVPTSVLRTEEGLLHEVRSSGSRLIFCKEAQLEQVMAVAERCDIERIIVTSTEGYDVEGVATALPDSACELRDLLGTHDVEPPEVHIDPKEDLCELAFTGGATGVPKGVMLTHANRLSAALQGLPWLMKPLLHGIAGKASVLLAVPLFHAYGGFVHQSAINLGLRIILLPDPRDTDAILESILEHRPFLIPGVPTQFMRLADAGLRRANAMLFSGAAPLPQDVAQMIKRKTGMPISEGYGLTESSSLAHMNLSGFSRITGFVASETPGVGVPCPDTECALIHPDTGQEVPVGQPGEVTLRGPQVMRGYWPEAGSGLTSDGWLYTGDIGVMDEQGYFRIVDRIKNMVNVSGMKVYTTEVDDVLFKHPAVAMAASFGVPDPKIPGSERVMAVVQLKGEQRHMVTEQEIKDFCAANLPPYAVPTYVEIHDSLPLTVTEKVFKRALREAAIADMNIGDETR